MKRILVLFVILTFGLSASTVEAPEVSPLEVLAEDLELLAIYSRANQRILGRYSPEAEAYFQGRADAFQIASDMARERQ